MDNLLMTPGKLSIDVAMVSVLTTVPTLEAVGIEVTLLVQLPLDPSDKSGVRSPAGIDVIGFNLAATALSVLCALDIRVNCKLCRIGLELRGEGLDRGCDSKICTCRSGS